jgi:hypothetical protein
MLGLGRVKRPTARSSNGATTINQISGHARRVRIGRLGSRRLLFVPILAGVLASCGSQIAATRPDGARSDVSTTVSPTTSTTDTTTSTSPNPSFSEVAQLGGDLTFTATTQLTTGTESAVANITLDQVIEPAPQALFPVATNGGRNVQLQVTIENDGNVTIPVNQGEEYGLSIEWSLDPDIANSYGVTTYQYEGLPDPSCGTPFQTPQSGIAPGQSMTGCIPFFNLPNDTMVTGASALLLYAGVFNGLPGEWQIS